MTAAGAAIVQYWIFPYGYVWWAGAVCFLFGVFGLLEAATEYDPVGSDRTMFTVTHYYERRYPEGGTWKLLGCLAFLALGVIFFGGIWMVIDSVHVARSSGIQALLGRYAVMLIPLAVAGAVTGVIHLARSDRR